MALRAQALVTVGALMLAVSGGETAFAEKSGGIIKIGQFDSPAGMSILEESSYTAEGPMMGVFNNLVFYDQHEPQNSLESVRPDLATGWLWDESRRLLTLHLRHGVQWHDDKPFTAAMSTDIRRIPAFSRPRIAFLTGSGKGKSCPPPAYFSVLYKRASRLFVDLAQARGEGRLPRLLTTLERIRLLIIDDWGPEPLNAEQRRDLLEIADDRYEKGSLLLTSQVPVSRWHELVGDPTIGDALLDRIVHRAHRIELKG